MRMGLAVVLTAVVVTTMARGQAEVGGEMIVPNIKVCVPVADVKKTPRVVYGCKTVDYCVPWPNFLGRLFHQADGDCVKCRGPRTRKVLLKRFVTDEVPATKCEVREVPQ